MLGGQAAGAPATLRDKRLAVLEFEAPWKMRCDALRAAGKHAELELDDRCKALEVLTDAARTAAADLASGAGMTLFTQANTLEILGAQQACLVEEGDCALATGRALGVHFLLIGKVSELEGTFIVDLQFYDVRSGAVLPGARQAEGQGLLGAVRAVRTLVPEVLQRGLGLRPAAPAHVASTPAVGGPSITVTVEPESAILEVDGQPAAAGRPIALQPGTHRVMARHDDYVAQMHEVVVRLGQDNTTVEVTLVRKPTLSVASTPAGATLRVDGRERGRTDLAMVLDPGTYDLELELAGFENVKRTMKLAPGQEERLSIALVSGLSAQERGSRLTKRRWAWGLSAAAAAGLAVFAWQGLDARAHDVKAGDLLAGTAAAKSNASDQKRAMLLADTGLVVGVLAAVPAGILWWKVEF